MIKPLPLYIGLRYIRAKRRSGFISFIAFASTIGIALGVMVLITVLSVMNGFEVQIRSHFFAMTPQVTISTEQDMLSGWPKLANTVSQIPAVRGEAPFVSGEGLLIKGNQLYGVQAMGILPDQENQVSQLGQQMVEGYLSTLTPNSFFMIVGKAVANQMNLQIGDTINFFTAQTTITPLGLFPRYRRFTIAGIYSDTGSAIEQTTIYMAMSDAQKLFAAGRRISGLHMTLNNPYQASAVTAQLRGQLPNTYQITDWTVESGAFFQALAMERIMMFIILLLIIAIAVFNLMSMLVMVVHEKRSDVAILRTLGALPKTIMQTFMIQGALIGLVGTMVGLMSGLLLTTYVNPVVNLIQRVFHVQFIPMTAYWSDRLPTQLLLSDVVTVCGFAWVLSVLATIYPAWIAFRIQPAEALRYE